MADEDRSWYDWLTGKPEAPEVQARETTGGGHRGIAAGDLRPGRQDLSAENVAKWEALPHGEVDDFVYGGVALVVHSTNVQTLHYDIARHVLTVQFLNGSVYEYDDVTEDEAIGFAKAQSKGGAVHTYLIGRGAKKGSGGLKPYRRIR